MSLYLGQTRLSANRGSYGVLKKNLANIDTEGIDYLLNSKSILSGDIGSNSSVYNNILNYKHSTFDKSKFTVAGSPTITDDGVASGFSSSNYLSIPTMSNTPNKLEITIKLNAKNCTFENNFFLNWSENFRFVYRYGYNYLLMANKSGGSDKYVTTPISMNTDYVVKYEIISTNCKVYLNGELKTNVDDTFDLSYISSNAGLIGRGASHADWYWQGSIDLKSFAIWVDGVQVFNGNKTGLDVIKQDNYEVVGNPTITEDGVASGFSASNYIKLPFDNTKNNFRFNFNIATDIDYDAYDSTLKGAVQLYINSVGSVQAHIVLDGEAVNVGVLSFPSTKGEFFEGYYELNNGIYTFALKRKNDIAYKILTLNDNRLPSNNYILRTCSKTSSDLNLFEVYVDGNLVYQPCLKIPYTESKTGSKIVDSIYRQRISDLYELQGYAPYYSLDEQNQTYTLPKGEVYGMINKYGNEYTKSHITNTIFNTSNNINLVNSNGNLVLKAGSILYFPNGFEEDGVTRKFITKTISSDKTIIYDATNRKNLVICLTASLASALTYDYECYSSTDGTIPPSVNRRFWYDMQNNVIKTYAPNSDTAETELISFPIALVDTLDTANKFSISKVFNSVGYIDKCLFTLPDIQLLCPNGIKDNSLNNNVITIKDIMVNNREDNLTGTYNLRISPREIIATAVQYDYHNNVNSLDDKLYKDSTIIGTVEYASGRIINLNYSDTLSLVHYGNFSDALSKNICTTSPISSTGNYTCTSYKPAVVIYNYVNGKSWYRLYSDGYCEQGGETEVFQSNTQKTISLLKQLIADNYQVNLIQIMSTDSPTCSTVNFITQRNSDSFTINYSTWGSEYPQIKYLWEAKGYIQ